LLFEIWFIGYFCYLEFGYWLFLVYNQIRIKIKNKNMDFRELLNEVHNSSISDVHFQVGKHPSIRLSNGKVVPVDQYELLTEEDIYKIIEEITTPEQREIFKKEMEIDFSFQIDGKGRYRANVFKEREGSAIALRLISEYIPKLSELGLEDELKNLLLINSGLILVTGPTGSGKSTTLASMIDYINENRSAHIITIEDPIEFYFTDKKSLITQREVNSHTLSFEKAIRSALREDPDVVMVGEMRDKETISSALTLAETGHLVFSTLHTSNAVQTIDRIIDNFPHDEQEQIRHQLASSLKGVISQILIPRKNDNSRVAAREIMITNDAIKNCIIKGDNSMIYSMIEIGAREGMMSLDQALEDLVRQGIIEKSEALSKAIDLDSLSDKLNDIL
jgi:twitching motility protein PilT